MAEQTQTPNEQEAFLRKNLRGGPDMTPEDTVPELLADRETKAMRERLAGDVNAHPEDTKAELLAEEQRIQEKKKQEEALRKKNDQADLTAAMTAAAAASASANTSAASRAWNERPEGSRQQETPGMREAAEKPQDNAFDVGSKSGHELGTNEFIIPRRIANNYTEVDGKFFSKDVDRPRLVFQDKGEKLTTSTTDKTAVADMVDLAKAKQWSTLKLSGSQEFRREAWLQAESQGIKTKGYTPKESDLVALENLRQQRATNTITPLAERKTEQEKAPQAQEERAASRHDLNKNQAGLHDAAQKNLTGNIEIVSKIPGMKDRSMEEVQKLAYWRGIVAEENKLQPPTIQKDALARFDAKATDPQFLAHLDKETQANVSEQTTDRAKEPQELDTHGQSL